MLEWPKHRNPIFAAYDTSIWPTESHDAVYEDARLGCFWAIWSLIQINKHDPVDCYYISRDGQEIGYLHCCMQRLMIPGKWSAGVSIDGVLDSLPRPAPLKWLKVRVCHELEELFHKRMTMSKSAKKELGANYSI